MTDGATARAFQPLTASIAKEFLTRGGWTREEAALVLNGLDPLANRELITDAQASPHPMVKTYLLAFERFHPNKRVISVADWLHWANHGTNEEPRQLPLTFARDLLEAVETGKYERLERLIKYRLLVQDHGTPEPWWVEHPDDPVPQSIWQIAARYFARQWVKREPALHKKRNVLAQRVEQDLKDRNVFKRGGQISPQASSIKNAFTNVDLTA